MQYLLIAQLLVPLMYNSSEAQVKLIEETECSIIIAPASHIQWWDSVRAAKPNVRYLEIPDLEHFYGTETVTAYPFTKKYQDVFDDIFYIIQTSGTTGNPIIQRRTYTAVTDLLRPGNPKPLPQSYATVAISCDGRWRNENVPEDQHLALAVGWAGATSLNIMPYSWIAGIIVTVYFPLMLEQRSVVVLQSSIPQPTPLPIIKRVRELIPSINTMIFTPMMIKQMVQNQELLKLLLSLETVWFAGAPLDEDIGDMIAKHTRVQSVIGSTDIGCGYPTLLNSDNADWMWIRLETGDNGWQLVPFTDGMYELVVDRVPDTPLPWTYLHPEMQTYHTSDLFCEHPEKKGYWRPCGRTDDFVKLASMTKFNAISIESALNRHAEIARSVVGGDARHATFVILQPTNEEHSSKEEALEKMWPGIETANQSIFSEARLSRQFAIVTDKVRPIELTQKGTAQRMKALRDYADEVRALYEGYEI